MAKKEEERGKSEHHKPKHKLKSIHTHVTDDGSFVHEHHYEDNKGHSLPPRFGGVSENMEDLHQHMDDHLGPEAAQGGGGDDEEQQGAGAGAGAPQPGAGAAQPDPEAE